MPTLRVTGFDGAVPRTSPTMLADSAAQVALNVKLYSGELRFWRGPLASYTPLLAGVQTIYKLYSGASFAWMTWNTQVDVVPGPLADTTESRLYYTGAGTPKKTNFAMATGAAPYPTAFLEMGVPAPATPPSVSNNLTLSSTWNQALSSNVAANDSLNIAATENISGSTTAAPETQVSSGVSPSLALAINSFVGTVEDGSISKTPNQPIQFNAALTTAIVSDDYNVPVTGAVDTRSYVYTFLSTFGAVTEESAPSPPSVLIGVPFGGGVTVGSFAAPPTGFYNITGIRIYRTVTGANTSGYEFVAQIGIGTASFLDTLTVAQLGAALSTIGWVPPPAGLTGIVALACGSLAGFVGNTVYFSEPFFAHAWPFAYAISVPYNIVGLGVMGNTVVVMTDAYPYTISGVSPATMSCVQVPIPEPCVSKLSIVSTLQGVSYASPNGLVNIGAGAPGVTTDALFRRDEWQAANPSALKGIAYDSKYVGIYVGSASATPAMLLSGDDKPALSYLSLNAVAAFMDTKTAKLFIVGAADNIIYEIDADNLNPLTYQWRSRRFVLPKGTTYSAIQVDAAYDQVAAGQVYANQLAAIITANGALFGYPQGAVNVNQVNGMQVNGGRQLNIPVPQAARSAQVLVYGDLNLVAAMTFAAFDPMRLPPFRSREIEIVVQGNVYVRSVKLATTVQELAEGLPPAIKQPKPYPWPEPAEAA